MKKHLRVLRTLFVNCLLYTSIKLLTRQLRPGAGEIAVFGAPIARLDSCLLYTSRCV